MRRLGSGLLYGAFTIVLATSAFFGCTASGETTDISGTSPEPSAPARQGLPPSSSPSDDDPVSPSDAGKPKKDAGSADAGKKDASVDAGPTAPVPGTPCTDLNKTFEKQCGACGKHSAICLADTNSTTGHWSDYSACFGETGECVAGTVLTESCGNCGTRNVTCSNTCVWSTGACTGQPQDSCSIGSVDLAMAGCPTTGIYRQKVCKADCTYQPATATCDAPPSSINIGPSLGNLSSTIAVLTSTQTAPRLTGTCPAATFSTTTSPYTYVVVNNPLAKAAVVSVYNSVAPDGVVFATVLASYVGNVVLANDAARKACDKGVALTGTAALTGDIKFASLDGTKRLKIPAGGAATIYLAAKAAFDPTKPAESTGPVKVNVKTEALED